MNSKDLYKIIRKRQNEMPKNSYVASLLKKGEDAVLQKIGEEATEIILAAKNQSKKRVIEEVADLWFHMLVLLSVKNITLNEIFAELERRNKKSTFLQSVKSDAKDDGQR